MEGWVRSPIMSVNYRRDEIVGRVRGELSRRVLFRRTTIKGYNVGSLVVCPGVG